MPVASGLAFFREGAEHRSDPVVDEQGRLLGLVSRNDALRWQGSDYPASATLAETLSDDSQPFAFPDSPSGAVADLIIETGVGRIPIIDPATRQAVRLLSRQALLKAKRPHRVDHLIPTHSTRTPQYEHT